jgi:AbrB family looped-hinge helix DNA binding protein
MEQIVKVTRNYQITIPATIRAAMEIREGDVVKVVYDEHEGVIKVIPLRRRRTVIRLGRSISVEEIEKAVEMMMNEATA